ncbi:MAG TPA: PQQ-binding-like beta-propeller repeat protein, partial [Chthoniobacteraceae bacterium]|nr:PQQ-binding-like beta-propeller repeat protein [Chthoniobacteraceae bacterium]
RVFGFLGLAASLALVLVLVHPTMRGPGTSYLTLPMGMLAFALAVAVLRRHRPARRTGLAVLLALAGFGFSLLLRNEGMTGEYQMGAHWRWSQTPEAAMLAGRKADRPAVRAAAGQPDLTNPEWPGFRGADRAARAHGPLIATDWAAHPPKQLWKIAVGPAWSSFAVAGRFLFTQEQRGPAETVVCYDADTGREVWNRPIEGRLDDPLGGPGPRATPALGRGGLFVTCATGAFLRLNPSTGEIVWQQDLKKVAERSKLPVPMWGFSASPIVAGQVVIVYAGGPGDKGLLAFDLESGALRWSVAAGLDSYSSPQLSAIAGETVLLMLTNDGLVLVDPVAGQTRLNYEWKFGNYRALQPDVAGPDMILLPTGMSTGTRAIRVTNAGGQLAATELWTSKNLKPDFTDLVTYQGYAFGNDAGILTCIDLKTGDRQWKGGRYGKGQVLLLEDSGLLLIAAEDGQVVLLRADPKQHAEVSSFKALDGKTWNHPVLVGDRLYVRNSQEAACYQLPLAGASNQ